MKTNQQIDVVIAADFSSVTFKTDGLADIVLDMTVLHADIIKRAACVGMAQVRIVDAAAIPATDKAGNIMPRAERLAKKHENMAALVEHYMSGTAEWSRVATSAGPKGGYLFEALCRMYPEKAPTDVRTWLDGLDAKAQTALREDSDVEPVIRAIKAEKAAKTPATDRPNTKALLAGLTTVAAPSTDTPTAP